MGRGGKSHKRRIYEEVKVLALLITSPTLNISPWPQSVCRKSANVRWEASRLYYFYLSLLLLILFLFQSCCRIFDATTAEGIQDLCRKSLRRLATQEEDPDELETFFSSVDQGWHQLRKCLNHHQVLFIDTKRKSLKELMLCEFLQSCKCNCAIWDANKLFLILYNVFTFFCGHIKEIYNLDYVGGNR